MFGFFEHRSQALVKLDKGGVSVHKKTILKFNSTKPVRPAAWLALAILAFGAFGNSVQAQFDLKFQYNYS